MSPSITVSLSTVAELLLAATIITAVVVISRKPAAVASNGSGSKKGKAKHKKREPERQAQDDAANAATRAGDASQSASGEQRGKRVTAIATAGKRKQTSPSTTIPPPLPPTIEAAPATTTKTTTRPLKKGQKARIVGGSQPAPTLVAPLTSSPSFASVAAPDPTTSKPSHGVSTGESSASSSKHAPSKGGGTGGDMRDYELDPVVPVPRVMTIQRESTGPTAEWLAWSQQQDKVQGGNEDGGWEVAVPKSAFHTLSLVKFPMVPRV